MADGMKRFHASNEEDYEEGTCIGAVDVSAHNFFDKIDVTSNSFPSSPNEPIYDLCKLSNQVDGIDTDQKINTDGEINLREKSDRVRFLHASRKKHSKRIFTVRDVGRWKPADDLLLIINVLQVNDLDIVCNAAKFSCKFNFGEVQSRWNALLYDELVSRTARSAIRKMHPEQQSAVHRRALFSLAEEDLLSDVRSTVNPNLEDFQNLLDKNSETFYHSRTAKSLQKHWRMLRKYELLCDQRPNVKFSAAGEMPPSFSDAEAEINIESLKESTFHGHVEQEIKLMDQQLKRRTRLIEDELSHWMQLLGVSSKHMDLSLKFDSETFAILRGQHLLYAMTRRFISFGRITRDSEEIDVDLSIEGPAQKISRYQGAIELRDDGTFATCNFGKRQFFVDGRPVFAGKMYIIRNNSIFEIFGITFEFLINKEVVEDACFNNHNTD